MVVLTSGPAAPWQQDDFYINRGGETRGSEHDDPFTEFEHEAVRRWDATAEHVTSICLFRANPGVKTGTLFVNLGTEYFYFEDDTAAAASVGDFGTWFGATIEVMDSGEAA